MSGCCLRGGTAGAAAERGWGGAGSTARLPLGVAAGLSLRPPLWDNMRGKLMQGVAVRGEEVKPKGPPQLPCYCPWPHVPRPGRQVPQRRPRGHGSTWPSPPPQPGLPWGESHRALSLLPHLHAGCEGECRSWPGPAIPARPPASSSDAGMEPPPQPPSPPGHWGHYCLFQRAGEVEAKVPQGPTSQGAAVPGLESASRTPRAS